MRPLITLMALALLLTAGACSGGDKESFRNVDHDKNGKISYEEVLFVFPEVTPDIFRRLDTDGDGTISEREYVLFLQSDVHTALAEKAARAAAQAKPVGGPLRPNDTNQPAVPFKGEEVIEIVPPAAETAQPTPPAKTKPEKEKGRKDKSKSDAAPRSEGTQYTVLKGDHLSRIAQKFGVSVEDITRANGNMNPDTLRDGQVLTIPPRGQ